MEFFENSTNPLSTFVLLISVMQSVNGPQFLNITFLIVSFTAAPAVYVFGTVMVPLTSMYASLQSHKCDRIIDVLNLVLLLSYILFDSSFISTQFLAINLDGWFIVSYYGFIVWYSIIIYYYYINLPLVIDHQ